jgi:hypothetical protein
MFLGYIMLQIFCGYDIWYMQCYFQSYTSCTLTLVLFEVCRHGCFLYFFITCFPCMLLYVFNYFEMVLFTPIVSGITFVFTFHMPYISVDRSLYFKIYPALFITSLSHEIAMSVTFSSFLYLFITIIITNLFYWWFAIFHLSILNYG